MLLDGCHEGKHTPRLSEVKCPKCGEWVDVYICGEDVTIGTLSGNTRKSSGTSYSAAKITAHAAQIISQAETKPTPADLRQQILSTAKTLPGGEKFIP